MKQKLSKSLVLAIVVIFFGVSFSTVINATSLTQNETLKICEKIPQENIAYFYCIIDINGTGNYYWFPIIGTFFEVDGTVTISALFSMDITTREIIKFFDGCSLNGDYMVLTKWFIGTTSVDNENLVAHGYALCALAGVDELP
jgi:hypothetical protein